jgi:hypothetical protein
MDLAFEDVRTPDIIGSLTALPSELDNVGAAYCGHVLEHLPYSDVAPALRGLRQRMVPGGRILAVGPDVDRAAKMLAEGAMSEEEHDLAGVGGAQRWHGDYHHWACTEALLLQSLEDAGFRDVRALPVNDVALGGWPVASYAKWQAAVTGLA